MLQKTKRVIVTPAGRKYTLEILAKYVFALKKAKLINEWHLWKNTKNQSDIDYIDSLSKDNKWIKIYNFNINDEYYGTSYNLKNYWQFVNEKDTVYVRFDDDIVFVELESFDDFIRFRLENPDYLVVYPNIINNTGIAFKQQQLGIIPKTTPMIGQIVADNGAPEWNRGGFHPCDAKAWADVAFCEHIHKWLIYNANDRFLSIYKFKLWELEHYETVSINSCSWIGSGSPNQFLMDTKAEEGEIVYYLPKKHNKINCVYGGFIVSHYAFYPQKSHLDVKNIDKMYNDLSDKYIKEFLENK